MIVLQGFKLLPCDGVLNPAIRAVRRNTLKAMKAKNNEQKNKKLSPDTENSFSLMSL